MSLWSERSFLRDVQYQTDANLAARQSIYAYQHPPVNLISRATPPPCRSVTRRRT
jgi:hypothetical protein